MDNFYGAMLTCIIKKQEERGFLTIGNTKRNRNSIMEEAIQLLSQQYGVTNDDIEQELSTGNYAEIEGPITQAMKEALNTIASDCANAKKWVDVYKNSSSQRSVVLLERLAEYTVLAKSWRSIMEALTGADYSNIEPRLRG